MVTDKIAPTEAALILKCDDTTVRRLIRFGHLKAETMKLGRLDKFMYQLDRAHVEEFAKTYEKGMHLNRKSRQQQ